MFFPSCFPMSRHTSNTSHQQVFLFCISMPQKIDGSMLHINVFGLPNDESRDCDVATWRFVGDIENLSILTTVILSNTIYNTYNVY